MNKLVRVLLSAVFALSTFSIPTGADEMPQELNVVVGDLQQIPANTLSRVSVTNPEIADISDAQNDKVMIVAKKAGQTALFVWDADGKHTIWINVSKQDLGSLAQRLQHIAKEADIKNLKFEPNPREGKVVVSGPLPRDKRLVLEKILDPYLDQVINVSKDEISEELIQIDMQITEVSATLDKNLGFDWQGGKGNALSLDYTETGLPTEGSEGWFKFGKFDRTTAIVNTVNLLINEGKARDLSRPRILVSSGKEATINVGGEVPIQSTTTNATGGSTQSNITFKQYGVTLIVTPTIREGKIDVVMNLEVSDVDKTFPIRATTTNDIAYKTRSAQTELILDDRQTVVFAGLIRYNDSSQTKRIPFLGKIPVLGLLFRNQFKQSPDEGKELVITLTPTIVRKKEYVEDQIKLPTQNLKSFEEEINQRHNLEREKIDLPAASVVPNMSGGGTVQGTKPAGSAVANEIAGQALPTVGAISGNSDAKDTAVNQLLMNPNAVSTTTSTAMVDSAVSPYVRSVQMKISQAITYPYEALQKKWQGTVKLKLRILKDGSLAEASVLESSGHPVFDQDALNTAKIVAPYQSFSPDVKSDSLTLTLPIVYSQTAVGKPNTHAVTPAY